jgi:hypothetical protein
MAISKRLRYEILRRDNHTCRYCGGVAPEVVLRVDHVVPRALGGSDEPSNLVASCHDCNAGKTSSAPDQNVVSEVSEKALQWSAAITQAADEARSHASGRDALYEAVVKAWPSFHQRKFPKDFTETVDQFVDAGLPHEVIVEMSRLAGAKPSIYDRWAYFCGCCWTKIRQLQDRALEIVGEHPEEESWEGDQFTTTNEGALDLIEWTAMSLEQSLIPFSVVEPWVCWHDTKFHFGEMGENYPCSDMICLAQFGQHAHCQAVEAVMGKYRDEDVMDAADELEMAH